MKYRVVQWATGAMGKTCLRAVLDHPDLELAGLRVYSQEKAGKDAGDILKCPPTGVFATRDTDEILSMDADIVIHAARIQPPYAHHNQDICRLLASGKNVITINGHTYPRYWGPSYVKEFEDACRQGNSTLFGTGLNPGFIVEKIVGAASGLCSRIDRIVVSEVAEGNAMKNPNYVFDVLGFGSECGSIDPNDPAWAPAEILNGMYSEVVAQVVDRLGFSLDRVETDHEMRPATSDISMAAGVIKKGTVSHTNWRWHGIVCGRRFFTLSIFWIMERTHLETGASHLWNVTIDGVPGVDIAIDLRKPEDARYRTEPEMHGLAASVVNSIPAVCRAEPGVMQTPVFGHFTKSFSGRYNTP
jgi:hypothetical protein